MAKLCTLLYRSAAVDNIQLILIRITRLSAVHKLVYDTCAVCVHVITICTY